MGKTEIFDLVVVGGGAAGFFAAINAAEVQSNLRVVIIESGSEVLRKVRISGGGRCNVTHACFEPRELVKNYPRGGRALLGSFTRFQPRDTVEWFKQKGVRLKAEADGRMFPESNHSETIVDCFLQSARRAKIEILTGNAVALVTWDNSIFCLRLSSGEELKARKFLLATGGGPGAYKLATSLGHSIIKPVPSLFTFNVKDKRLKDLMGLSVQNVHLRLPDLNLEQSGPLLVTHWGLSGPAVLKLSAWGARKLNEAQYKTQLQINWLPHFGNETEILNWLVDMKTKLARKKVFSSLPDERLPQRLWIRLFAAAGVQESQNWADISRSTLICLAEELGRGMYAILGKGQFKDEFVTCGGVDLDEVDFKTLQSKIVPGLYFAGEVLDVDGITGGFNFQNAWTTAWLAARDIARNVREKTK